MIIIPARLASTRFEQKVLVDVMGLPMVVRTAKAVCGIDRVVVATDDEKILKVCSSYDIEAVMTSNKHKSGTDRINECASKLGVDDDEIIINVQADEPFIEQEVVLALKNRLLNIKDEFVMGSCYAKIDHKRAEDPNLVKVVLDANSNAIYFSRSPIPYNRGDKPCEYFGHIGIYGFSAKSLREFCSLDDAKIEDIEKLEQLRAIYHAKKIAMIEVETKSFGIDTPEDLQRALEVFGR